MLDVVIVGAGPAGLYAAYQLKKKGKSVLVIDKGKPLSERHCPIVENKVKSCIHCKSCSIMEGFGGAGAFSDGKFNITNEFGGTLNEKIGDDLSLTLMNKVRELNTSLLGKDVSSFKSNSDLKKLCLKNGLNLLEAEVIHYGSDLNQTILLNLYNELIKENTGFKFNTEVIDFDFSEEDHTDVITSEETIPAKNVIIAVGRSGSTWLSSLCKKYGIPTRSNRVDIGVRVELPYEVFSDLTDISYETKVVYSTSTYRDKVRTFCMNPKGFVVNENTNGIVTVNGYSNSETGKHSPNTNFALLVSQSFTEPFHNSNEYGENIVRLSNMLGGGAILQRFGDLIRGQRTNPSRLRTSSVHPTLNACPGDLSLVLPKRILDDIIETVYALDKIAPGTANDDTLLYGVEVKFYNMNVEVENNLSIPNLPNVYCIGDGSGLTHSLSQAAASGIYVADII